MEDVALQENIVAEASLSSDYPIKVHIGNTAFPVGSKEEYLHRRSAIRTAKARHEKGCLYNKGGKGRKRKFRSLDYYEEKERSYIDSRLHLYSRRLIDICVASQAGTLVLTDHQDPDRKENLILYSWGYYGLLDKIKYKAQLVGIKVVI